MKKNRQSLTLLFVIIGVVIIVGVYCYTQLEIVKSSRWKGPSREVRGNELFALEKWLVASGRPVRTILTGNIDTILNSPEKTIFIEASCFTWNDNPAVLTPWLESGGRLFISLDGNISYRLESFMNVLGIRKTALVGNEDNTSFEIAEEENPDKTEETSTEYNYVRFDRYVSFSKAEPDSSLLYKAQIMNSSGETKLIKFETGKGFLIFTGKAYFLNNNSLRYKQNINLAAEIFLNNVPEDNDNRAVLFIRALSGERHLLGNLAERGNPAALIISMVLLVFIGLWMNIPLFGRFRPIPESKGKPLHERFLAEGRFLKKNNALGKYIETYEKELEQRSRSRGNTITDAAGTNLKDVTFVQFIKEQKKLTEQLKSMERL